MKRQTLGVILLMIAAFPLAFLMCVWLDIKGLKVTEAFLALETVALFIQGASFFVGSALLF